jgi:hypothetical protein
VKHQNTDKARHARVRSFVAYPGFSIALVVSAALALTPFAPSALAATPSPTAGTPTASPSPTSTAAPAPSTAPGPTPGTAPGATPGASPSAAPSTAPSTAPSATAAPSVPAGGSTAPGSATADHWVLARIDDSNLQARYLSVDAPLPDAAQFETVRVRFTIHNAGTSPITIAPQLEYRPDGGSKYTVVPELALEGIPLHMVREWVLIPGGGTKQGPLSADIPVSKFLTGTPGGSLGMLGHRSMAANPDRPTILPSDSFTEQEFTVRLTMDAKYRTGYEFRITNGTTQLAGTQVAKISLGAAPALRLSPGQHDGLAVDGPKPATGTGVAK